MTRSFTAVLDACVLIPYPLFDVLLRAADAGLYRPVWSADILDEVERNIVAKLGVEPERASRRIGHMKAAFPDASVDGYGQLIPAMTNHQKDRHVLAAAVRANASLIVTANMKDFPDAALSPFSITATTPDDFLLDLLDLSEVKILNSLDSMLEQNSSPPNSVAELAHQLEGTAPKFTSVVLGLLSA
ncbi:MAG: putative toxin-antitoxin system toxin component, PIN family [Demequina sp.]